MSTGKKWALVAAVLGVALLGLGGCYTQLKLFTPVSEEPEVVQERTVPEYHYYYYYYLPRWDVPYWVRWPFYWPYYLREHFYWSYWDWNQLYPWYEPSWSSFYWIEGYSPWYGYTPYSWDYWLDYGYPAYCYYYDYYYDPWWGHRYHRQEKPKPSRRREYDTAIPRVSSETEKQSVTEQPSLWIRSRPATKVEKRVVREEPRQSTEVKRAVERKRALSSTEKKEEKKTPKRRRKADFKRARR